MSFDLSLGRWMEEDPATYVDGPNVYQVELSNPVIGLDPTGLADNPTTQPSNPTPPSFGDYKGPVPNPRPATGKGDADASTSVGIGYDAYNFDETPTGQGDLEIKAKLKVVFFDPSNSWVVPTKKNNQSLLHHEQGHWKVAWWVAQQAQNGSGKTWATAPAGSGGPGRQKAEDEAKKAMAKYFADFQSQMVQLQGIYDQYTQSGTNAGRQRELDQLTPEQLAKRLRQLHAQ